MKANEAPEKIYIQKRNNYSNILEYDSEWTPIPLISENNIEYTRTDAFIEKAEKFLEDKLTEEDCKFGWSEWTEVKSGYNPIDSFIRAFRKYMKEE